MENREYFRVQDVIPVVDRKVHPEEEQWTHSRVISGTAAYQNIAPPPFEGGAENIDSRLFSLLVEINNKLNVLLEKSATEAEGFNKALYKQVDLSEGGIRLNVNEKYQAGDFIELKLLLSRLPLIGLIVYGRISRAQEVGPGNYEVAVVFVNIENDVRETLWRYILERQRVTIRKKGDKDS